MGGRAGHPQGLSVLPPATRRHSPDSLSEQAGGSGCGWVRVPGWRGQCPACTPPPCRPPWLPWQMWMVSGARHCGSRGAGVAPTQSGTTFPLRRAARLHSPPCAPESLPVRKEMAIMGRGRQRVHPNGTGSIPESQGAPQQHRVNPSALILPEAGHRAEGLARAGLQHRSSGCRDALLWWYLGGHGFPDVGYKHPIAFPELTAQRPPTLLATGWGEHGDVVGSSGNA